MSKDGLKILRKKSKFPIGEINLRIQYLKLP